MYIPQNKINSVQTFDLRKFDGSMYHHNMIVRPSSWSIRDRLINPLSHMKCSCWDCSLLMATIEEDANYQSYLDYIKYERNIVLRSLGVTVGLLKHNEVIWE